MLVQLVKSIGRVSRIVVFGRIESWDVAYLEAEDLRLNQLQRTAVDLDEALASL